ncbi:hypothetical protein A2960_00530 [Candidatus Gottesmanbacteria bacterium RIFCSPLOWO2_01_FULL_39_12b]|uniref:Uncharacterized protein n=1 Tax=Candidatus Gottesmanbacteria bacterium RIFCSPLOWO2_01_FULL_39_12b TaxID=1798388 RepID=A0A1F6AQ83_9BACT|nr:MAG: hypothetical protein A2960_00530 [Candidatus Gottesmanbacteria bacterium RIFCSPLOWO2_01_FULL_39_12b]
MPKSIIHFVHYLSLILIFVVGGYFFYYFRPFPDKQFAVATAGAIIYILWGVIHHLVEGDFHLKIMVEYLVIAILGLVIARGAIFR